MDKLTSRKFLIAILSMVSGIAISLEALGGKIGIICAIISTIIPPVTYIVTEGVIDAKAIGLATDAAQGVVEIVEELKGGENDGNKAE